MVILAAECSWKPNEIRDLISKSGQVMVCPTGGAKAAPILNSSVTTGSFPVGGFFFLSVVFGVAAFSPNSGGVRAPISDGAYLGRGLRIAVAHTELTCLAFASWDILFPNPRWPR